MVSIVVGAGFGDEGKGQCVHALSNANTLVIRFSGGHQCGHTVVTADGKRHVFSQFGAGTLKGATSYTSQYCTVFPIAWVNEFKALCDIGVQPSPYFAHPLAMVTTPYDLAFNRALSMVNGHGTCGVGFGSTLQRNDDHYNLYAVDLLNPYVLETKLALVQAYYYQKVRMLNMSSQITYETELSTAMETWDEHLQLYQGHLNISLLDPLCTRFSNFVFEGSQGIMLDQHFGFFPHVTRSNTTSENALKIIQNSALKGLDIHTYYMSRCYLTRHGHGPFPDAHKVDLINTAGESNHENDWQGVFRTARVDLPLLAHALRCDAVHNTSSKKTLVFTCLDQLKDRGLFVEQINRSLLVDKVSEIRMKDSPSWTF